jgi:MiaB-like tRNA modifying enzyme
VPQAQKDLCKTKLSKYSTFGTNNIKDVNEIIDSIQENKILFKCNNEQDIKKIELPTKSKNKFIAIIPISEGCIGNCSYCKTKQARGNLKSYHPEQILNKIQDSLNKGAKEIWLTSQDTSCYGFDINTNLAKLLKKIIQIPKQFKIRIGMGNPNSFLKIIDEYLNVFKEDQKNNKKIYKFFHIPVQSGSDKILKDMNRYYTIKDFKRLIRKIKRKIKKPFIATDVIVGYPIESEKDFEKTLKLIKWLKPEMLNISRFWVRKGTKVDKLNYKKLPTKLVKQRSTITTKLFHQILQKNIKKYSNWKGNVLITEKGKSCLIGKNSNYKQVIMPTIEINKHKLKIGDKVYCKTKTLGKFEIIAEVIKKL